MVKAVSESDFMAPTIFDVAERAGVAAPTVSRVLNDSAPVREETKARVLRAVEELGYRPNVVARGLARGRLHMIAAVVPFVTHPSAVARVQGLVNGLRASGYPVGLFDVEVPAHRDEHLEALTSNLRPEGAVIISLRLDPEQLDRLSASQTPCVFLDVEAEGFPSLTIDDEAAGALATRHLVELGHRAIGFVGDEENGSFGFVSSARRRSGYRRALAEAGIPERPEFQRTGPHGKDPARELAGELLDLPGPPTAIFAASDTQALGVLEAAAQRGTRVPEDLSVVGFDDVSVAAYAGLTTVRQPLYESGSWAAELLAARLADPDLPAPHRVLPVELVERRSTGPPNES